MELCARHPGRWDTRELEVSADGRAVVEFTNGEERVIGKLRADGGGEAAHTLLVALFAAQTTTLRVPRPVAWLPEAQALVTGVAPGVACRNLEPALDGGTFERIGRALAELHALPPFGGSVKRLSDHVAELVRPSPRVVSAEQPHHALTIERTLAHLSEAERQWGAVAVVSLHRDFHLRQLFDDGLRITVIDWDDAACGDPAFDVGYFTAYLRTHYALEDAVTGINAFRRGYGDGPWWDRVPVYERFNYLRRACRRVRLRDEGWQRALDDMLARLAK